MTAALQRKPIKRLSPAAKSALSELTENQATAFKTLYNAITNGVLTTRLLGYAGTGKTHTLTRLVPALNRPIVLTAPTNKAAAVLRSMSATLGSDVEATTIHKALGLRPAIDFKTGNTKLQRVRGADIPDGALVVVDEASMVSRELLELIIKECQSVRGVQILFVGDPAQLPPVGESHSPALIQQHGATATLTEIVRQRADHPVLKLTAELRSAIDGADVPQIVEALHHDGSIRILDSADFEKELLADFQSISYRENPDTCRALTYTNERSRQFNALIRRALLGSKADDHPLLPGEVMICCKPIIQYKQVLAQIGDTVQVIAVEETEEPEYGIPALKLKLQTLECGQVTVFVVRQPDGLGDYRTVLTLLSKAAKERQAELNEYQRLGKRYPKEKDNARKEAWCDFFSFKDDRFADLRPIHSSTVHRSQGSTYGKVFIDLNDIGRCTKRNEVLRLLYVALTRPQGDVVLTGNLPRRLYK